MRRCSVWARQALSGGHSRREARQSRFSLSALATGKRRLHGLYSPPLMEFEDRSQTRRLPP